ncbi:MAG: cobalt-precorrin-4 C(11)-methyltransferase, partial [Candidatus Omnitrophica bacterium]|nr:cobalt-precorrin-4 C(11)-methyltransferase [Candidatus Omnitrophota bacterium]
MKVYFIGAGPGDPGLLTIKAKAIISRADIVIFAGSLVNREVLKFATKSALIYDSSKMTLEEILGIMKKAKAGKKTVARVHSGDPSIY